MVWNLASLAVQFLFLKKSRGPYMVLPDVESVVD